jgi:hypothetical protein
MQTFEGTADVSLADLHQHLVWCERNQISGVEQRVQGSPCFNLVAVLCCFTGCGTLPAKFLWTWGWAAFQDASAAFQLDQLVQVAISIFVVAISMFCTVNLIKWLMGRPVYLPPQSKNFLGQTNYRIDQVGFEVKNAVTGQFVSWDSQGGLAETRDLFVVYDQYKNAVSVPKRMFPDVATLTAARQFMLQQIAPKLAPKLG